MTDSDVNATETFNTREVTPNLCDFAPMKPMKRRLLTLSIVTNYYGLFASEKRVFLFILISASLILGYFTTKTAIHLTEFIAGLFGHTTVLSQVDCFGLRSANGDMHKKIPTTVYRRLMTRHMRIAVIYTDRDWQGAHVPILSAVGNENAAMSCFYAFKHILPRVDAVLNGFYDVVVVAGCNPSLLVSTENKRSPMLRWINELVEWVKAVDPVTNGIRMYATGIGALIMNEALGGANFSFGSMRLGVTTLRDGVLDSRAAIVASAEGIDVAPTDATVHSYSVFSGRKVIEAYTIGRVVVTLFLPMVSGAAIHTLILSTLPAHAMPQAAEVEGHIENISFSDFVAVHRWIADTLSGE
ncbi:hypothetical protein J8273_8947 [Carpediemonas membranifera]|uniref:Uncharacterized protein n=1 Tax=Carpediemonas membranifera TaxID=201153 RepID=A0A8J6DYP8_9EUKA|nr:hypothetical protein J8273_8947 [Carpediemonas membranifera]|eukprot:KAG9389648.1 hypothetical protein J8273_8947 [Carpediemonas membranifera]